MTISGMSVAAGPPARGDVLFPGRRFIFGVATPAGRSSFLARLLFPPPASLLNCLFLQLKMISVTVLCCSTLIFVDFKTANVNKRNGFLFKWGLVTDWVRFSLVRVSTNETADVSFFFEWMSSLWWRRWMAQFAGQRRCQKISKTLFLYRWWKMFSMMKTSTLNLFFLLVPVKKKPCSD